MFLKFRIKATIKLSTQPNLKIEKTRWIFLQSKLSRISTKNFGNYRIYKNK